MLKSLRVPERLFQLAGWAVSVVFAGFLIGLGGQLVGELPGVDQRLTLEQFMDPVRARRVAIARDSLVRLQRDLAAAEDRARLSLTASSNAYRSRNESFNNWIATRVATTDPRQDPEVLRRTRELSEHYGLPPVLRETQKREDVLDGEAWYTGRERREASGWVVLTAPWLEWMWSHTNYHEVHHKYPYLSHSYLPQAFGATRERYPYEVVPGYWRSIINLSQREYYGARESAHQLRQESSQFRASGQN